MSLPLPWWAKVGAKVVLAHLPLPASFWQKIRLFRHGGMDDPAYALRVFRSHYGRQALPENWTCLELGPGNSLFTALIAKAHGAGRIYLIDSGDYAERDMAPYRRMAELLKAEGLPVPDLTHVTDLAGLLALCNVTHGTQGLADLKQVESASIDFAFSNAVLEHVRRHEFAATMAELKRVQKPTGYQSHAIDLRDHMQSSLNNLRFPEKWWESDFLSSSGFYTNRLRHSEITALLQQAGFAINQVSVTHWPHVPLPRNKMQPAFRDFADDDLRISTFDVVLKVQEAASVAA